MSMFIVNKMHKFYVSIGGLMKICVDECVHELIVLHFTYKCVVAIGIHYE